MNPNHEAEYLSAMTTPSDSQLAIINELLRTCSPMGAYCLGALSSLAWRDHLEPPRELLEKAAACTAVAQVDALYHEYRKNTHE